MESVKRPIDAEEDAAKRQRQDEQAALGQLTGSATFPLAPLAPLEQQLAGTQSLLLPEQLQQGGQQPPQGAAQLQQPTLASPEEKRICFPFLNRGMCQFSSQCKFRHLTETHPDAIADRMRTGHTHRLAGFTGDAAAQVRGRLARAAAMRLRRGSASRPPPTASRLPLCRAGAGAGGWQCAARERDGGSASLAGGCRGAALLLLSEPRHLRARRGVPLPPPDGRTPGRGRGPDAHRPVRQDPAARQPDGRAESQLPGR